MGKITVRFLSRSVVEMLLLGLLLALPAAGQAVSPRPACPVVLAWDSLADSRIAGYALYYGPTGSPATNRVNVGSARMATIYNLSTAATYSFFVVAYDANGIESSPSNPLPYSPPALSPLRIAKLTDGTARLQFRAAPGTVGRIEYTPSLSPRWWKTLNSATADTNGYLVFLDPNLGAQPARFYRAVLP
jgi:Fibronectin type III domain